MPKNDPNNPQLTLDVDDSRYTSKDGKTLIIDKEPPLGKNDLGAMDIFQERKYYKEQIYPNHFIAPTPLDLWYERKYFGKIDNDGNAIFADNSKLKQLKNDNDPNIFALDFVVDAFNDFKSHFLFLNKKQVEGTPFALLTPERATRHVLQDYDVWMDEVYQRFSTGFMSKPSRQKKLIDFNSFVKLFNEFVQFNAHSIPLTLSKYIYSPLSSPSISGLMIEITSDSHGNDLDKFNHLISNDNFLCYVNSAEEFGFKIDKNMPGRMIADIKSPAMKKYMQTYPQPPKLFDTPAPPAPLPNPPPPPEESPQNLYERGDIVEWVVMWPDLAAGTGNDAPAIILKDHSEPIERATPIGQNSKRVSESYLFQSRVLPITSMIKYLIIMWKKQGFVPLLFRGRVTDPSPVERLVDSARNASAPPSDPNGDPVAIINVIDVKTIDSDMKIKSSFWDAEVEPGMLTYYRYVAADFAFTKGGGTPGRDDAGVQTRNYARRIDPPIFEGSPTSFEKPRVYIEVPRSAVHIHTPTAQTITRFTQRLSYQERYAKWEDDVDAYFQVWDNTVKKAYDRNHATWEQKKLNYDTEKAFYENAPKLEVNNVINRRMIKASDIDVYLLKQVYMQFYNSYASDKPIISPVTLTFCDDGTIKTKNKVIRREQITQQLIESRHDDKFWLQQYFFIRYYESGQKLSPSQLANYRNQAILLFHSNGLTTASQYINQLFNNLRLTGKQKYDTI